MFSVTEELTEHLAQWSYSVAFYELSFIPSVRLRKFCKSTKVDRFGREMKQLISKVNNIPLKFVYMFLALFLFRYHLLYIT